MEKRRFSIVRRPPIGKVNNRRFGGCLQSMEMEQQNKEFFMSEPIKLIVLGCGSRGNAYSKFTTINPDRAQVGETGTIRYPPQAYLILWVFILLLVVPMVYWCFRTRETFGKNTAEI